MKKGFRVLTREEAAGVFGKGGSSGGGGGGGGSGGKVGVTTQLGPNQGLGVTYTTPTSNGKTTTYYVGGNGSINGTSPYVHVTGATVGVRVTW